MVTAFLACLSREYIFERFYTAQHTEWGESAESGISEYASYLLLIFKVERWFQENSWAGLDLNYFLICLLCIFLFWGIWGKLNSSTPTLSNPVLSANASKISHRISTVHTSLYKALCEKFLLEFRTQKMLLVRCT